MPPVPLPADDGGVADAELLRRHAAGDVEAFGTVVARHQDRLWAVALRTLGDREEAADALQDALVSALRASARGGFRGESAVTTWLHRIVVNACLDRVRRRAARPAVPLPEDLEGDEDRPPRAPAAVVADPAEARTTELVVRDALRALPPEQAAALVLVDLEGWSVADAAEVLGVAPGTVKSRCARGRARLVPLLAGVREGAPAGGNRAAGGGVPGRGAARSGGTGDGSGEEVRR
ncbi:RNA polymerase sigma factor SigM [Vallicoccus soli]|uniref:RNA polymerase sigma factor SigM n=1 Tax=Vallicoccus soli TaxID=2339232 RepID=A0A3A3YS36_9ACTN|nr:RNA polymerase sigma factor SigM [Vallicoccus soli]RJK94161.1 RNA polymerase sigma factor SigM [Vallicoccus soli]